MRCSLLFALLLTIAGCTSEPPPPDPTPPSATPPGDTTSPTAPHASADSDTSSTAWTAGITTVERSPGTATLRSVRSAAHDGFDRTVFEFAGEVPGYHVEYIDEPVRQCGSGNPVPLPGDGRLEVRFSSTRAHTDDGTPTLTDRERTPDLAVLRALTQTCDFEGTVTWVLALAAPNRYRVMDLSDPARLVVDVRH